MRARMITFHVAGFTTPKQGSRPDLGYLVHALDTTLSNVYIVLIVLSYFGQ